MMNGVVLCEGSFEDTFLALVELFASGDSDATEALWNRLAGHAQFYLFLKVASKEDLEDAMNDVRLKMLENRAALAKLCRRYPNAEFSMAKRWIKNRARDVVRDLSRKASHLAWKEEFDPADPSALVPFGRLSVSNELLAKLLPELSDQQRAIIRVSLDVLSAPGSDSLRFPVNSIAWQLGIGEESVKTQLKRIKSKASKVPAGYMQ